MHKSVAFRQVKGLRHDFLGFIPSVLTVCSLFPQVLKLYQTQRTHDLSLGRYSMIFVGTSLWSVYFWDVNWIECVNEVSCAALYSYILYMKLTEKQRE